MAVMAMASMAVRLRATCMLTCCKPRTRSNEEILVSIMMEICATSFYWRGLLRGLVAVSVAVGVCVGVWVRA